jgi:hypothetical protein
MAGKKQNAFEHAPGRLLQDLLVQRQIRCRMANP